MKLVLNLIHSFTLDLNIKIMLSIIKNKTELAKHEGEICAAGTDVYARRRLGISGGKIRDISNIKSLEKIEWHPDGSLSIGALVKIATIANDEKIKTKYPTLAKAAGGLATPQIRNMATLGGNLLQKNRCWYYRNPAFTCFKSGGNRCPARIGNHQYGVAFDLGPCVAVHPSTLGMVLKTYDATIEVIGGKTWTTTALYGDGSDPYVDHQLPSDELLTTIHLPIPENNELGGYTRAISRFEAEWALVEAAARLVIRNKRIELAKVAIGAVANIPLALPAVDEFLLGQPATEETFRQAAIIATEGASPLLMTDYKVKMIEGVVLDTLLKMI